MMRSYLKALVLALMAIQSVHATGAELDMKAPTAAQRRTIETLLGADFIKGDGAFPPELLVASPDLDKDGLADLVVVQQGFCSNHWCTYVFAENRQGEWAIVLEVDSWLVPHLDDKSGQKSRPEIIVFDHVTDDCMTCSPPQPIRYVWRNNVVTPGGAQERTLTLA